MVGVPGSFPEIPASHPPGGSSPRYPSLCLPLDLSLGLCSLSALHLASLSCLALSP